MQKRRALPANACSAPVEEKSPPYATMKAAPPNERKIPTNIVQPYCSMSSQRMRRNDILNAHHYNDGAPTALPGVKASHPRQSEIMRVKTG